MKFSVAGGILGGIISGLISVITDSPAVFFAGVITASILSGFDGRIFHRFVGLVVFYVISASLMLLHTILYSSNAVLGWLALVFYSVVVVPLYFVVGFLVRRFARRT